MKIREVHLQNFKRFTDLTIRDLPDYTKLVLLIGANGSGKTSVFDAFNWAMPPAPNYAYLHLDDDDAYFQKNAKTTPSVKIITDLDTIERSPNQSKYTLFGKFYGRSSLRIVTKLTIPESDITKTLADNLDAPTHFTEYDNRFITDVYLHADQLNQVLQRLLVTGQTNDQELTKVREKYILKINHALANIFGHDDNTSLRFTVYKQNTPSEPITPYFTKGTSEISFDLLSHGEKQVIIILFNFLVRQEYLADKIIYIDEMDGHMNTRLQFNLLKEITENWIPGSSQLWTASHALGFIDYARQSAEAVIIDFDSLDFDLPQTLTPEPKENTDILEIAVPKEVLQSLLAERHFIFCEGADTAKYNSIQLANTIFASHSYNKHQVFSRARDTHAEGVIDRDYLTDDEIIQFEQQFPFIHILRYYSIENYLYHPANLAEYLGASFDQNAYINALTELKNRIKQELVFGIQKARENNPFDKELSAQQRKDYQSSGRNILALLDSDDFETFYKVFPAKDYGKHLAQRQNLNPLKLAQSLWFKQQITPLLIKI